MKSGALVHGAAAYGASALKPGFSFTAQMDLALALGFNDVALLWLGHPDDHDPVASLDKWWSLAPRVRPERVARCFARDYGEGFRHAWRDETTRGPAKWLPRGAAPLDREEARRIFEEGAARVPKPSACFVLEALTTPDDVLGDGLDLLERKLDTQDEEFLETWAPRVLLCSVASRMLLRVEPAQRDLFRERIASLRSHPHAQDDLRRAADETLQVGRLSTEARVVHGTASADEVVRLAAEREIDEGHYPDAREVFLGGERVIEITRRRWREYDGPARKTLVERYGWIRSEQVVLLFLDMLASKLKEDVLAWFVDRADYARPILADLEKQTGPTALQAKKALKHVDGVLSGGTGEKPAKPKRAKVKAK
jgi:hypothetical protein